MELGLSIVLEADLDIGNSFISLFGFLIGLFVILLFDAFCLVFEVVRGVLGVAGGVEDIVEGVEGVEGNATVAIADRPIPNRPSPVDADRNGFTALSGFTTSDGFTALSGLISDGFTVNGFTSDGFVLLVIATECGLLKILLPLLLLLLLGCPIVVVE